MAEEEPKSTEAEDAEHREVAISYVKSNFFRVIHADGAWGGLAPRGDIHISFYNERRAIPDISKVTVSKRTGHAVKPEKFEATSQFVREIEVDVVVDLNTAIQLRGWLDRKIKALQLLITQAQQGKGTP